MNMETGDRTVPCCRVPAFVIKRCLNADVQPNSVWYCFLQFRGRKHGSCFGFEGSLKRACHRRSSLHQAYTPAS